jgi:hypothetical protein
MPNMSWGAQEIFAGPNGNAILFASWAILPAVCIACLRQIFAARRATSNFALHTLESIELSRATLLYEKAFIRLEEINRLIFDNTGSLRTQCHRREDLRRRYRKELEDVTAYASHLRATIVRIRSQPLQRFRARAHALGLRFAFIYALAIYGAMLSLLLGLIWFSGMPGRAELLTIKFETLLIGRAVREPLLYANAVASGIVILVIPLLYLTRRVGLRIGERAQIRLLKEFATPDPVWLFHSQRGRTTEESAPEQKTQQVPDTGWTLVLGVPRSATIDEIKDAYKLKVKQNHPDRVHGMADIFKSVAEAETKKLNAAYEEAMVSVRIG